MKTESLIYFVSIASTGSITKTAAQHFISQQAVSEHIKKLEKEFNITLLQKTQNGVKLTEQGKIFLEYARTFLSIYQEAQLHLNSSYDMQRPTGTLRLAVHWYLSYINFGKFIVQFHSKYPDVQLSFDEMSNSSVISALHQNKADIGFFFSVRGQSDITDETLQLHTLYESDLYYCYAKTHPLANLKRPVTKSDIESYTLTSAPSSDIDIKSYGLNFFQSVNLDFLLDLVSEGVLVGIFPDKQAKQLFKNNSNIILTPIKPPYFEEVKSSVLAGYLQQNEQNLLINLFVKELKEFYRF